MSKMNENSVACVQPSPTPISAHNSVPMPDTKLSDLNMDPYNFPKEDDEDEDIEADCVDIDIAYTEDFDIIDFDESNEFLTEAPKMSKRKSTEKMILDTINLLDSTGENGKAYKKLFASMNDKQFDSYMENLSNPKNNFYLECLPNKNEPTFESIKAAADYLGIMLDEYVYMRRDGNEKDPIRTSYRVPVVYLHIKRMQQTLSKKNTSSLDISQRNLKTGNLTGDDKIARISDMETYSLKVLGAENTLKEFLSARADNENNRQSMYRDISLYGYTKLSDLPDDEQGQAVKITKINLISSGIATDI